MLFSLLQNLRKMENLIKKLHATIDQPEIEKIFLEIAKHLMNELCINAGGEMYRITECEFYYDNGSTHKDPYIYPSEDNIKYYGKDQQKEKLCWFFHAVGIDLTIGDGNLIRGGILIRGIEGNGYTSNRVIKLTDHIFNFGNNDAINGFLIKLESCKSGRKNHEVKQTKRIGLKENIDVAFYNKEYRYFISR